MTSEGGVRGRNNQENMSQSKESEYRKALERIANHFNHCDLSDDRSAMCVVQTAASALGWKVGRDRYEQVELTKGKNATVKS